MWIDNTFEAAVPVGDYVSIDERLFILPEARTTEPPHDLARLLRLMNFDGLHEVHGMTLEELALTINSFPATVSVLEGLVEQHGRGFVVSAAWDRAPDRAQATQGSLQELLRKPVTDLPLSIRARNCFERHRVNVLGDLVRQTESELLRVKGLGRRTLREIRAALWELGLDIGAGLPSARVELPEPAGPGSWPISGPSRDRLIAAGIDSVPRLSEQNERSLLDGGVASLGELLVLADALWHMTGAGFAPMSKRTARLQLNLHSLCPVTAVGWPHEIARNLRQIGADTLLDAAHKTTTDLAVAGFEAGDLARVERELWRRGLGLACKADPRLECHSVEIARMFAIELSVSPPEPDRVIGFVEDELSQCLRRLDQERNVRIAEQCFGWDGQGGATLAQVAVGFGLSRERVSQVRARLLDRFRTMSANTPSLEAGIRFIAARLPAWAQDLEAGLATAGLCRRPFRLEGLIGAARERRIPADFVIVEERGLRLVVAPDFESEARVFLLRPLRGVPSPLHKLLPKLQRQLDQSGPEVVDNVASAASPEAPSPVSATEAPAATASTTAVGAVTSELARWMLRRARERALFPGTSCWSLIELGWQSEDLAGLREWGQTGHKTPRELKRVRVLEGTPLAGRDEIALVFLAYAMDVGRQQAHEGELWPFVRRALSAELQEWFFSDAQLRPWIRDALEMVCPQLSLRHVFGQDGIQAWIRTVFLQFGLSEAGWERLPWWLSGHRATVTVEDLLNPHSQLHSKSFEQLWKALQRGRFGHRDQRRLRRELEDVGSPWLMAADTARVAAAAIARPEVVRVDDERPEISVLEASPSLLSEPLLRWHAGHPPRFELGLVAGQSGLSPGEYILVIPGHVRLAVSLDAEGAWHAGSDSLLLEPRETRISFEVVQDGATVVQDVIALCDDDDELFLFDLTTGRRLDPWSSVSAGRRVALLTRSDLAVSPEPHDWRSIFGGAWKLWRLDSGLPSGLKVSLGSETLWMPAVRDAPAPVPRGRVSSMDLGRWGETVRLRVEMQGGLDPVALRLGNHAYDIKHIEGKRVADVLLDPSVAPTARARAVTLTEGRRSTVPVQLELRKPWGIARQWPCGRWQPVRTEDVLDPAEVSTNRLVISAPSTWRFPPSELAVLEGHVFQARPRTAERGLASSLHGLGASLSLCRGPYNRADESVTLVAAVIANGLIADLHDEEGDHHLRLRHAVEATDEHSVWVWSHGQDAPKPVSADRVRRNADEWRVVNEPVAPLAFAVAYRGAWLGARYVDSRTGPADMAASIAATADWRALALWLRWWRAPILSEPLLSAVEARAMREPVPTLSAWLGNPSGLPPGLRLPQEDPGWPTVVQHLFWRWRPSALQAMSLIAGLGLLSGDPATDWKKGWTGFEDLLTVHPVLLALIARHGVPALYPIASREETATLLYRLRDRVAERDDESGLVEWRITRAKLLEAAAKSMQVNSAFIDPGLWREAKELVEGGRPARDNLRIALVVGPLRRFIAACLLHDFAREIG